MLSKTYPWQEECLAQWFSHKGRGIVEAVTGSGKTRLALEACRRLEERQKQKSSGKLLIKIVVPTAALMSQWSKAIREYFGEDAASEIGLCGGGVTSSKEKKYTISVVNSARYSLARQILADLRRGDSVFLIADECHHYTSGENSLIFEFRSHIGEYEEKYFAMGLSATLPRGEARDFLSQALGSHIYRYGLKKALDAGTVCRYDIFHIALSFDGEESDAYEEISERMQFLRRKLLKLCPFLKRKTGKDFFEELTALAANKKLAGSREAASYIRLTYKRRKLVCLASARIPCAARLISLLSTQEKILIFGERITQAEELYRHLAHKYPGQVGRYHSQMGEQANRNTLSRFRDGEIRILIVCRSLDEGIDIPEVSVGIILSGTSTMRQRIQRLGRIIRRADKKERASLYYLHIEASAEDTCYLPDNGENRIYELQYLAGSEEFYNEEYDRAAEAAWKKISTEKAGYAVQEEFIRCISLGSVSSDWQREPAELEKKLAEAKSIRERNYWFCMKKICCRAKQAQE